MAFCAPPADEPPRPRLSPSDRGTAPGPRSTGLYHLALGGGPTSKDLLRRGRNSVNLNALSGQSDHVTKSLYGADPDARIRSDVDVPARVGRYDRRALSSR